MPNPSRTNHEDGDLEVGIASSILDAVENNDSAALWDLMDLKDDEPADDSGETDVEDVAGDATNDDAGSKEANDNNDPEPGLGDTDSANADEGEPAGVQSKSGDKIIPYEALETARTEARERGEQLEQLQAKLEKYEGVDPTAMKELDALQRKVALYESQLADNSIEPAELPENFELSDERRAELKDFGTLGETLVAMHDAMQAKINVAAGAAAAPAAEPAPAGDPVMDVINSDADLTRWREKSVSWGVVQATDAAVQADPAYAGKSLSERMPRVKELVRQSLGEGTPAPKQELGKQAAVETPAPSSLSEITGQSPDVTLSPREQIAQASNAVEAGRLMQHFADKGVPMDQLID